MTISLGPRMIENCSVAMTHQPITGGVPLTEERLAILGHEIRNPLSALSYALQAWPSSEDDPQLTKKLLEIMRRQVSQLTRLSDDLLDTGRIARGQLTIKKAVVDLRQVIHLACEEVQPAIDRCGHTLAVEVQDRPFVMLGDESRLLQVLANLIQNSTKFTDRNGNLSISLKSENDTAVICVHDNGRGMSPEDLQSIFGTPTAIRTRATTSADGLGIGLRLAKSIVELHDGSIDAFSDGLGHGSSFVVKLPVIAEWASARTTSASNVPATEQDQEQRLSHFRILVVDDERSMRFLVSRMLQKIGQSVTVADNGETAIQTILRDHPQVVFLDLQMHGISGYDVAREIRSRVELNRLCLIALSGNADAASKQLAAESGFDRYLVKPVSMDLLVETLVGIGEPSIYQGPFLSVNASNSSS